MKTLVASKSTSVCIENDSEVLVVLREIWRYGEVL